MRWWISVVSGAMRCSVSVARASRPMQCPGHTPVDDKGGPQRWPKDQRLIDQRDHLTAGPDVVGTRLHRNQDQVGGEQCRTRQGGHTGWSVDHDVIDAAGDLRRFEVQRFSC